MMLPSLHHNGINWSCSLLGEQALLLKPKTQQEALRFIHRFCASVREEDIPGLTEIVPAYDSVAVFFDESRWSPKSLIARLEGVQSTSRNQTKFQVHEVPVCYELGLDWERVMEHTGLPKHEIIIRHTNVDYTVAMIGFVPGFIFLAGLDEQLSTPRLEHPRSRIPEGSVGIGGNQTGLYSLESPGGWNIIGRTNQHFFDASANPPMVLSAGDTVRFVPITKREFEHG